MKRIIPLPPEVLELCERVEAQPELVEHLTLVHDCAVRLTRLFARAFPQIVFDREAVLYGAAIHDLGKVWWPDELVRLGRVHENEGQALLEKVGVPPQYCRFARTHGSWDHEIVELEDLLVALADHAWRTSKDEVLEGIVSALIAQMLAIPQWEAWMRLDEVLTKVAPTAG